MRDGRGRRVAPPPDGPSAIGAGMRQSRDLTSGAGVLSSRGAPRVLAGPPRSVTGRRGRGEGVRFVADGRRPLLRADRPPLLPRRASAPRSLVRSCPAPLHAAAAGADERSANAPAPGAARSPTAAAPSPQSESRRVAAAPRARATRGRRRWPRAMGLG